MNKNPILPARMDFFFHLFSAPKISPLLPTTYQPLPPSLHRQSSKDIEREQAWSWSRGCWSRSLEQELGAWSRSLELPKLGAVGVGELWLEPEWDPRRTQVSIFTFFLVCLFCLFCLFFFIMFLWSCATTQCSEEGDGNVVAITFFFFFL
jgi:hypothetical protein